MEIPAGISESAWHDARHMLSNGFTTPIIVSTENTAKFAKNLDALRSYDFKLVSWNEFAKTVDLPFGLATRAFEYVANSNEAVEFVIYDPLDDDKGYLLLGIDPIELSTEICQYIADSEPEEGPLSVDARTMAKIEGH